MLRDGAKGGVKLSAPLSLGLPRSALLMVLPEEGSLTAVAIRGTSTGEETRV